MPIQSWDVAGARLRVRTGGRATGPTVILAVDPPNVVEAYARLFVALAPHARLIAFEPPGFGRSTAPRGFTHSWADQVRVLEALVERTGPAVLAFPCVSAYAALLLAGKRPDLVRGLVLPQAPSWEDERAWLARVDRGSVLRTPGLGQLATAVRADAIARKWYEAASGDVDAMRPLAALGIEALSHDARFPLAAAFQAMWREAPALAPVTQPTLLVWGDRDRTHKKSEAWGLTPLVPHARLATLEGAGHFPELERPIEFAAAVESWMKDTGLDG